MKTLKPTNPFPTNAEILRSLKLPTTYRVTQRIRADINVANILTSRFLYEIDSPTAGHVPVKAAWTQESGAVEITGFIFRQLIAITFGISAYDLPAKPTNNSVLFEHFKKHGTRRANGEYELDGWRVETTTNGHFVSFWDKALNRAGVEQVALALGVTLPNPQA